jgi:hypothetical protein
MRQKLEKYQELDYTFGGSRECQVRAAAVLIKSRPIVLNSHAYPHALHPHVTLATSLHPQFLNDLTTAFEDFNLDDFTDHVYNFDNVSKLDAWKTS